MAMQMHERDEEPQRWFKRRKDGAIFPMADSYHITRLLQEGWVEVEEEEAKPKPAALTVVPAAPVVDPRDAKIAALEEQLAQVLQLMQAQATPKAEEPSHAVSSDDVANRGGSQRPDRRPR